MILYNYIRNELRKNLIGPTFLGFLGIFFLFLTFGYTQPQYQVSYPIKDYTWNIFTYGGLAASFFFVFIAARSYAREFETRTMNIMVTTPLSRDQIFLAKFISIALLIPFVLGFILIAILCMSMFNGTVPAFEWHMIQYQSLLFTVYMLALTAFTTLLSVTIKRSAAASILVIVYNMITIPFGIELSVRWVYDSMLIDYQRAFFFPGASYSIGMMVVHQEFMTDPYLVATSLIFIIIFYMLGAILFRRSQIWG
jgi:ABC-type transport system involved in multi-copper enzyme maturation permease subunit